MIRPREIQIMACASGVRDTQIEKDYVLSWILCGISQNKFLLNNLVFKGGTCLKKMYYPEYRFSEDLDFTCRNKNFDPIAIKSEFQKVLNKVYLDSRIKISLSDENIFSTGNYRFHLPYMGPLGGISTNKNIKVDIARDELICEEPQEIKIINLYSDLDSEEHRVFCYSITEIISEKMRSLMQRSVPRDLYDLWYLFEIENYDIRDYIFCFQRKAEFKGKNPNEFIDEVLSKEKIFKINWEKSLSAQMNKIPDFNQVWREIGRHLRKFERFT